MRPASSMAPVALTLACARNWFAPGARLTRLAPSGLPSAVISTVACGGARRIERDIHGKALAAEDLRGHAHRFQHQAGPRLAGQRNDVDGHAALLRLPDGARDAAQVLVAVGDQQHARHHAGRQRGQPFADGGFQIGAVRGLAGAVCQFPGLSRCVPRARDCAARGRRAALASSCARARSPPWWPRRRPHPDPAAKRWRKYPPGSPRATLDS